MPQAPPFGCNARAIDPQFVAVSGKVLKWNIRRQSMQRKDSRSSASSPHTSQTIMSPFNRVSCIVAGAALVPSSAARLVAPQRRVRPASRLANSCYRQTVALNTARRSRPARSPWPRRRFAGSSGSGRCSRCTRTTCAALRHRRTRRTCTSLVEAQLS